MALSKVLANFTTSLATKISSTASSLTLSRSTDPDGTTLSGQYILTVDEGTSVEEHMLVTLAGSAGTIDTRGLSKVDMTTSVAANKFAHDRGAETKITNAVLIKIVNRLNGTEAFDSPALTGVASIAGLSTPTSGETTKAANVAYVNAVSIAGAADATTTVKGIVELATAAELAAGTATGATGANLVAAGTNFKDTSSAAVLVPVTNSSGKLSAGFGGSASTLATLNGSSLVVENPANATATPTASKIPIADATAKINDGWLGLTTAGDIVYSDGTDLQRLAIGTARQTLRVNSGATAPAWTSTVLGSFTTDVVVSGTVAETTLFSLTVPGGTIGTAGIIKVKMYLNTNVTGAAANVIYRFKYGATTVSSVTIARTNSGSTDGFLECTLYAKGATNSQEADIVMQAQINANAMSSTGVFLYGTGLGTAAEDSTADKTLVVTVEHANSANNTTASHGYAVIL